MFNEPHAPGIYVDLPMDEYLGDPSLSASGCKEVNEDLGRYWHNSGNNTIDDDQTEEEGVERKFGTAYHMMVLEPKKFNATYKIKAGVKQTKAEDMLGEGEYQTMLKMRAALFAGSKRRELLDGAVPEVSFFWRDEQTNVPCRIRVDAFAPICWSDLKALRSVKTGALRTLIPAYGFDVTGVFYSEAWNVLRKMIAAGYKMPEPFTDEFVRKFMECPNPRLAFMMQEKAAPFITRTQLFTRGVAEVGLAKVQQAMHKYALAMEQHEPGEPWPVEYPEIENMEIENLSSNIFYN